MTGILRTWATAALLAFGPPAEGEAGDASPAFTQWREGVDEQRAGHHDEAVVHFERAMDLGRDDPRIRLYLASSLLALERFEEAKEALSGTEDLARTHAARPLLLARAQLGLDDIDGAYATLYRATQDFPADPAPRLELVALCAKRGLFETARGWAWEISRLEPDRDTVLAVFDLLYDDPHAAAVLEALAAAFPEDADLLGHLAYGYASAERWHAAATLFERATLGGEDHAFEAADQYRMAGNTHAALIMNARVEDPTRRLEQRMSILIAAGEMARVVALEPQLRAVGLNEPRHRYNLAFAHYALGQFARSSDLARHLIGSAYEDRARALLGAMGRSE